MTNAQRILKDLVNTIEATGGLVNCNGTHVPNADPEWSDLGDLVMAAHQELIDANLAEKSDLTIVAFDGSPDDYLDEHC